MVNKVVFFAMTKKGFYSVECFIKEYGASSVGFVVSHFDKHVEHDYFNEIKELCKTNNIVFYDKDDKYSLDSKIVFVIGWRWLINTGHTLIVFHDSPLPRYRGFSPLVTQLLNMEVTLGVTCFYSETMFDTGSIIGQSKIRVTYPLKVSDAIDALCPLYDELIKNVYSKLSRGEVPESHPQNPEEITYCVWRDEEDYQIDWSKDSAYIKRFIDSTGFPYFGASSVVDGAKVRISDAEVFEDTKIENRDPGKVLFIHEGYPVVICGTGLIKVLRAHLDETREDILPLKKFRTRFK